MLEHVQITVNPDFIVAGFPKCATTWLAGRLEEHPDLCVSRPKEPDYWPSVARGPIEHPAPDVVTTPEAYASTFSHQRSSQLKGDCSVTIAETSGTLQLIRDAAPDARVIFSYRDPVERLWSDLWYENRPGRVRKPPRRFVDALNHHEKLVRRGRYVDLARPWMKDFDTEHVFDFQIRLEPGATVMRLYRFLGVNPEYLPEGLWQVSNPAGKVRTTYRSAYVWATRARRAGLGRFVEAAKRAGVEDRIARRRLKVRPNPTMPSVFREDAAAYYEPYTRRLERLLSVDLTHWTRAGAGR